MKKLIVLLGCAGVLPAFAGQDLFARMDADRDRRISAVEHAAAARAMFESMDHNRDGKVTPDEMWAAQHKVSGRKASALKAPEKIDVIDSNQDGVLSVEEHVAGAEVMFAMMDRNRDGKLTRAEYRAGHAKLLAGK